MQWEFCLVWAQVCTTLCKNIIDMYFLSIYFNFILKLVFTGCGDGVARAYDAKSATLKRIFQGHEGAINCLVCVDDKLYTGKILYTGM